MPLVHRKVHPHRLSNKKLQLDGTDSEFIAVNNGTLVAVLRQLASLVSVAGEIFSGLSILTGEVGVNISRVKLRLEELEIKTELFDPKLIPVPEGNLDLKGNGVGERVREGSLGTMDSGFFIAQSRPEFLVKLYLEAGKYSPNIPQRSPLIFSNGSGSVPYPSSESSGGVEGHVVKMRDERQKASKEGGTVTKKFPGEVLVSVDVTGSIFDRMRANRRSLLIYTKRIRQKKKQRRNTICGSLPPNKECGIQTSLGSVTTVAPTPTVTSYPTHNSQHRKYGGDSGHWSTSTESRGGDDLDSILPTSVQSPWEQTSRSNSSDFFYDDDEDRTLTPQLENFTDGMVSDSDSVDTEGYFTSFRNECGFPRLKKTKSSEGNEKKMGSEECDYELFGQGSTSTTASSCGTVVMRQKLELPADLLQKDTNQQDGELEERVKRKSLIERIPSLVVVTPSPSCSSASPPPKDRDFEFGGSESDECQTNREEEELLEQLKRVSSYSSSTLSSSHSHGSTETLRDIFPIQTLPQPDVIADVYQLTLKGPPSKLDSAQEYCSLESPILLGPSQEEQPRDLGVASKMDQTHVTPASKSRGARVVLDANGEIIFSSETLRHKVSFDPGEAVKPLIYDTLPRERESVYDRLRKESTEDGNEKLYECIQEIRSHNLRQSEESSDLLCSQNGVKNLQNGGKTQTYSSHLHGSSNFRNYENSNLENHNDDLRSTLSRLLLETDLDSAIPPVMPELKTLPKIKDCLKRNESYRMATDEVKVNPDKKVSTISMRSTSGQLIDPARRHHRDIPEEDPAFIQQVLSFSQEKGIVRQSPPIPSKFPVSPEDRPSFLRNRESPPTMEEISKQIYHFRKKFNIQPIALSRKLCSPQIPPPPPQRSSSSKLPPPRTPSLLIPLNRAQLPQVRETSIITPLRHDQKPEPGILKSPPKRPGPILPVRFNSSLREHKAPSGNSASSLREPKATSLSSVSSLREPTATSLNSASSLRTPKATSPNSASSLREPKATSLSSASSLREPTSVNSAPKSVSFSPMSASSPIRPKTSLSHFKRLLSATALKGSPGKTNSVSAVEVLRPRLLGHETKL